MPVKWPEVSAERPRWDPEPSGDLPRRSRRARRPEDLCSVVSFVLFVVRLRSWRAATVHESRIGTLNRRPNPSPGLRPPSPAVGGRGTWVVYGSWEGCLRRRNPGCSTLGGGNRGWDLLRPSGLEILQSLVTGGAGGHRWAGHWPARAWPYPIAPRYCTERTPCSLPRHRRP